MPTNTLIFRVKIIALIVFVFATAGVWVYAAMYEIPRNKCEAGGGWWSNSYRICRTPVYLPLITGRKPGEPRQITWPSGDVAHSSNPKQVPAEPVKPEPSKP